MAIGNGTKVTPLTLVATALTAAIFDGSPWLAQPPTIGIASGLNAGAVNVLWDNTNSATAVPITSLIELGDALDASLAGQVVRRVSDNQSDEFIGIPILIGRMTFPTSGVEDFAIVKALGPANLYWAALLSDLEAVPGR